MSLDPSQLCEKAEAVDNGAVRHHRRRMNAPNLASEAVRPSGGVRLEDYRAPDPRSTARPSASSATARHRVVAQRRTDTAPELLVRRALHADGLRYRIHVRPIAGLRRQADIA